MNIEAPIHEEAGGGPPKRTEKHALAPLALDPKKYRAYLDQFELSEEQQNELLETLWRICKTFVEIGFGLDSVQNIFSLNLANALQDEENKLDRKDHFNRLAGPNGENNTERRPE